MKRNISIRTFLGLSHGLLLILSLGLIGLVWSHNEYQIMTRELQKMMRERVSMLATFVSHEFAEYNEIKLDTSEFPLVYQEKNLLAVYIDTSGNLYELKPGTVGSRQRALFQQVYNEYSDYEEVDSSLIKSDFNSTLLYAASPVFDPQDQFIGSVCLLLPLADLDSYFVNSRWLLTGAILGAGLLGVGVSYFLTKYFTQSFSRAQGLASKVARGQYHIHIPEEGPTELRNLASYLNLMTEKLQEQTKMRQTLLSNVAHELARPLAGLQLGIESLRKGAIQEPELADDLLVTMEQTIQRLDGLIEDVTLAAQPKTVPIELKRVILHVEPFLQGIANRFWYLADSRGLNLEVKVEKDLPPIYADEKRLNQIVGNLLNNAIKFTPPGENILLSAENADDSHVRLVVHDKGEGISPDEADRLFEPFYQGDIGRRIKQGMGLGLSIAQQLTLAHGGELFLNNHPEGGAVAILILPKANV